MAGAKTCTEEATFFLHDGGGGLIRKTSHQEAESQNLVVKRVFGVIVNTIQDPL